MKKYILLFILLFCASSGVKAQTFSDDNFIYTASPKKAVQSGNYSTLTKDEITQTVTYFDGLGRPVQTVGINQGGNGEDIITPVEYDAFGRQQKDYLPYPVLRANNTKIDLPTALTAQQTFYNTVKYENTSNAFSQKQFEASPLNRVLKQAAPGNAWAMGNGHEIKLDYQTNTEIEVKLFKASASWDSASGLYQIAFTDSGNYAANELYKNITYDENSAANPTDETLGATIEFKNKEGQVVLKRTYDAGVKHDTYYIYDIYGNLTYVIPPKADGVIDQSVLNILCYQYKYDNRNRLVEKKLPGKQWEFIVYDKLDRPVATGPSNSPFSDIDTTGWIITKYDAFSRPVYTGWATITPATGTGRKILQDAQNTATSLFETKQTTGDIHGIPTYYSNTVAPTDFELLTVSYYDNYTFPSLPAIAIPATVADQSTLSTSQVKGLTTASWTRVLTTSASTAGETAATFYDDKARPVRIYTQNYLGGYTYTDTNLDFTGVPKYSVTYHKRTSGDAELKTKEVFTYSPQGRLLTQTHQINDSTVELIAENSYDELGQLITKEVGGKTQKIDYTYNIRGWLKGINNTSALQQGTTDPKDLFAFSINYNTIASGIPNVKALYNGNIAESQWATNSDNGIVRTYGYRYDDLNRLLEGIYKKGSIFNTYNESMDYDKNGNIMHLKRYGSLNDNTQTLIDDLTYEYKDSNIGNRLGKVTDPIANNAGFKDEFKDSAANVNDDFDYDANGNMTKDNNKNIIEIKYNHLNLPTKIMFLTSGNIEYIYNAGGQKVEKIVTQGTIETRTNYLGGYEYLKPHLGIWALQFFPTAEGYVKPSGSSYKYIYQYKDHLGNIRLSYDKSLAIQEENNYYPFGLRQAGYNTVVIASNNKYKYNGKEFQDELQLNMTAMDYRQYDNALGRFNSIDALSEMNYSVSPFAFSYNNPIFWSDPTGLLSEAFVNSLWENSAENSATKWVNDGGGTFSKEDGSGMVDQETGEFTGFDTLRTVTVTGRKTSGGGSRLEGNIGGIAQSKAYSFGKFYDRWRSDFRTKQLDDTQALLDGIGTVDPTGIVDGINALGYLMRGQTGNAAIAAIAIIPYLGDAAKGAKYSKGVLSASELLRIENAATRIGKPITVVGSRASGTAKAYSDWDYVIEGGLNSKNWSKIKNSLPGAKSSIDNMSRNIDIFTNGVKTELPHITVLPRQ